MNRFARVLSVLVLPGCAALQELNRDIEMSYGVGQDQTAATTADQGSTDEGSEEVAEATPAAGPDVPACKPDGAEVSHFKECCSNEAYLESIEDNGAWHSGRRLCGRAR